MRYAVLVLLVVTIISGCEKIEEFFGDQAKEKAKEEVKEEMENLSKEDVEKIVENKLKDYGITEKKINALAQAASKEPLTSEQKEKFEEMLQSKKEP